MTTPRFLSYLLAVLLLAVSGNAATFVYTATLDGPSESPANASPGTGFATVTYNDAAHTLAISATFSGLTGTTTASHIHAATANPLAGTAGVVTQTPSFVGFPLGVTSGTFSNVLDLTLASSFNPVYVTANGGSAAAAEAAFAAALASQRAYFNIHTSAFGGGEIRGFLVASVPDSSSTLALFMIALPGLLVWHRQRRARG